MAYVISMIVVLVVFVPLGIYLEGRRKNAWNQVAELLQLDAEPLGKDMSYHLSGIYREVDVVAWYQEIPRGRETERSTFLGVRLYDPIWQDLILEPLGLGGRLMNQITGARGITIDDEEFDRTHNITGRVHEGTYRALRDELVQRQFRGLKNSFSRYWMKDGVIFVEQDGDMLDADRLVRLLDRLVDRAKVLDGWAARNLHVGQITADVAPAPELAPLGEGVIW